MNPAAGLGNRLVALVSGFMLGIATDRAVLCAWEAYTDERVHRSKEVSTMASMSMFLRHDFPFDAGEALHGKEVLISFFAYRCFSIFWSVPFRNRL